MKIVYTRADGVLCVVHGAAKKDIETQLGEMTQEQYEKYVWEKSVPKNAVNVTRLADDATLPDREFRNAWVHDGKAFGYDLEKARQIQLERIRDARCPILSELDKEFMLCLEKGEPTAEIVKKKQILRDITESLKNIKLASIDDVKNAFPNELKEV